ncbi:MAG: enoyl-CoA hydratase/isomerase family protein [Azonexus sp.]|jgi:enoyl-CoA hydratase|nr:enoyl-CoA hydratase/isomerase family protein [Azonexus sp.]
MSTVLLDTPEDGIGVLTLNRPERLNAITTELIEDMHRTLDAIEANDKLRVIILTGAGRGFCAGYDLKASDEVLDSASGNAVAKGIRGQERLAAIVTRLYKLRQPVIAAVNGPAAGGGFALVLAADLRLAASSANFHVANARIGLSAGECGISWLFPRLVGLSRCYELMLTGRPFDAVEAERIGLVSRLTDDHALMDEALALARTIAANAPFGVRMTKQLVTHGLAIADLETAIQMENRTQVLCALTGDVDEAMRAFREKRPASFQTA